MNEQKKSPKPTNVEKRKVYLKGRRRKSPKTVRLSPERTFVQESADLTESVDLTKTIDLTKTVDSVKSKVLSEGGSEGTEDLDYSDDPGELIDIAIKIKESIEKSETSIEKSEEIKEPPMDESEESEKIIEKIEEIKEPLKEHIEEPIVSFSVGHAVKEDPTPKIKPKLKKKPVRKSKRQVKRQVKPKKTGIPDFNSMKRPELNALAKECNLHNYSKLKKKDLVLKLQESFKQSI